MNRNDTNEFQLEVPAVSVTVTVTVTTTVTATAIVTVTAMVTLAVLTWRIILPSLAPHS